MDALEWRRVALVVACLALAATLTAIRLTLARGSRIVAPADRPDGAPSAGTAARPPIRARVLGAMLVGTVVLNAVGTSLATLLLTVHHGARGAAEAALLAAAAIVALETLARAAVAAGSVRRVLSGVGIPVDLYVERLSAADEIRGRVEHLHQSGGVFKDERDMLGGLLDLGELTVSEVMVHRTRMRMLDADLPAAEIVREALASPYTRMPLWRGDPETIVGVLHAKDLLRAVEAASARGGAVDLEAVATVPWFVPDTTSLKDQLKAFLARKQHFALVVDEYGALMGLVTLEDILEEIVGEISDEHDVTPRGVRPQPDGSILVDGTVPIRDVNRLMDWHLPDEEATTVAGLVIHEAMSIPDAGQVFTFHGFRFEVLRRMRNRLTALRVGPARRE